MAVHVINYDLMTPGKKYPELTKALQDLGAKRVLLSTWLVRNDQEPLAILNHLLQYVDDNDRLFVAEMNKWAWTNNVLIDPKQV